MGTPLKAGGRAVMGRTLAAPAMADDPDELPDDVSMLRFEPRSLPIAAFRPAWASEMASWTPTRPRAIKPQNLRLERLGLGLADVNREDLAPAGLVDGVGDGQRLVDHAAAVADLFDLRVEEQVAVAALKRPRPERLHVLVQGLADPTDVGLGDPQTE